MKLFTNAFISRPYLADDDSYQAVSDTLERLPFMLAVETQYVPATDTAGSFIVATCKGPWNSVQVPFSYDQSLEGAHYVGAVAMAKKACPDRWESLAVLGRVQTSTGYLFAFGEDGLNS